MSDTRRFRKDDRPSHDGIDRDPAHQPGEVRHLVKDGQRINVTEENRRAAIESISSLTWDQMDEGIRRGCSILLARALRDIEQGKETAETGATLKRIDDISARRRATGNDFDLSKIPTHELEKATK